MAGQMGLRFTAWSFPWETFEQRIADIPVVNASGTLRWLDFGEGSISVPADYDRLSDIISSSQGSLIRVYDGSTIVQEFLAERVSQQVDEQGVVEITGGDLATAFDRAIVYPYDYPTQPSVFPNHVWGGPNQLQNPGFEDSASTPQIYRLTIDATAGTYTLSDGTDTTGTITWNSGDGGLESIIEADIAAIDDLSVSPIGDTPVAYQLLITATGGTFVIEGPSDNTSALDFDITAANLESAIEGLTGITNVDVTAVTVDGDDGFVIDFITPSSEDLGIDTTNLTDGSAVLTVSSNGEGFELELVTPPTGINLSVNDSGLTGTASIDEIQEGQTLAAGWTKSQQVSFGTPREFGVYNTFEYSDDQAHSGSTSLKIDPGPVTSRIEAFAGAQQVVSVTPGGTYQASIWVYPTASGQTYRFVIRGIDEDLIAFANVSPPANTWTQVTISDVTIPAGDSQVIFRFASIALSGNPATFYIDDAELNEGLAEATIGEIVTALMDDASTDHSGDTRGTILDWVDYSGFDSDDDSSSDTWDESLSFTAHRGMTYGQVFDKLRDLGYEWNLTPKSSPGATTHDLNWYNEDNLGTDYSTSDTPAVNIGQSVLGGPVVSRIPDYTAALVEGAAQIYTEDSDATAESNFGRFERYLGDRALASTTSIGAAAAHLLSDEASNRTAVQVDVVRNDDHPIPIVDYTVGDTLNFQLPPALAKTARQVHSITWTHGEPPTYQVTGSKLFLGEAGGWEAVRLLLRKFFPFEDFESPAADVFGGGGGMAHVLIVSDSEPATIQAKADYVVPASNSSTDLQAIYDALTNLQGNNGSWSIWHAGSFDLDSDVSAPDASWVRGLGYTEHQVPT